MKSLNLVLAGALAVPTLAACQTNAVDGAEIVAVLPLTGSSAAKGERHKQAIQHAITKMSEAGLEDLIGKPLQLTLVNAADSPEQATTALEEIFAQRQPVAVLSSTSKAHRGSIRPALANQAIHFEVSEGADNEEFILPEAQGGDREQYDMTYSFSGRGLCYTEAIVTARFIAAKWPGARLALLQGADSHDAMHTQVIRDEIAVINAKLLEEGRANEQITIVNSAESETTQYLLSYEVGQFQSEIEAILEDGAPDVIFWHLAGDGTNLRFIQDAKRAGFTGPTDMLVTCGMSQVPDTLDNTVNGGILDYVTDRLFYVNRAPPPSDDLDAFRAEFESTWGNIADTFTPSAFDSAMMVGLGLAKAGGERAAALRDAIVDISRPQGKLVKWDQLGDATTALEAGEDINYDGPNGSLDIRGCAALPESGSCPDTEKHYIPAAYYVDAVRNNDTNADVGEYVVEESWSSNPILLE